MTRPARTAFVAAFVALLTAACGGSAHAEQPKPPNPPGWQIVRVPGNGVDEISTFCDHGNRVYVVNSYQHPAMAAAAQDPTCREPAR